MTLHPIPLNFLIFQENFVFFFISVGTALRIVYALLTISPSTVTYHSPMRLFSGKKVFKPNSILTNVVNVGSAKKMRKIFFPFLSVYN
jgi:hypothetical protein